MGGTNVNITKNEKTIARGQCFSVCIYDKDSMSMRVLSKCRIQAHSPKNVNQLFAAEPAITYSSRVDTIQLRRVTMNKQTLLEWSTRFSGDATTAVLEDCKYKKREAFRDLRNTLGTAST